ncbi:MAG: hypothetical protein ACE5FI_19150 [Anaerolineales bacterium]
MRKSTIAKFGTGMAAVLAVLTTGLYAAPVHAHERIELGPYVIVMGWEMEPVIVGERNALLLMVTEDGRPVDGLEGTVDLAVNYGGRTFTANIVPGPEEGQYLADIFPTVRGQYEVHLTGTIGAETLDLVVEPEEVLSAAALQFPEAEPEARDLQIKINQLESRLQTAYNLAVAGIVVGVIGIAVGVLGLRRHRP